MKARKSEAGARIAAILSIVETCRRLKIPIRDYFASILPGFDRAAGQPRHPTHPSGMGGAKLTSSARNCD